MAKWDGVALPPPFLLQLLQEILLRDVPSTLYRFFVSFQEDIKLPFLLKSRRRPLIIRYVNRKTG
jgi:hypothetical protein